MSRGEGVPSCADQSKIVAVPTVHAPPDVGLCRALVVTYRVSVTKPVTRLRERTQPIRHGARRHWVPHLCNAPCMHYRTLRAVQLEQLRTTKE